MTAATIRVDAHERHALSPHMYSAFLETEINFGGEGGLLAQWVRNHDFEALGRGNLGENWDATVAAIKRSHAAGVAAGLRLDPHEPAPDPTDMRPWQSVGGATVAIAQAGGPFLSNPHHLRMSGGSGAGVSNPGYWGVGVRAGVGHTVSLFARSNATQQRHRGWLMWSSRRREALRLWIRLADGDGGTLSSAQVDVRTTGEWVRYSVELPASTRGSSAASLEVRLADGGEVWLEQVTLVPADAVDGRFRRDVFEHLAALRPGFTRLPGDLEGHGPRTRWDWKATLGPPEARRGHYNSAWKSWTSDRFGVYEMLRLCELLRTEAQLSIFSGYFLDAPRYPAPAAGSSVVRDALDLLEFANGPVTSHWGRQRAALGHPEPFGLKRLEVGNEERDMTPSGYPAHYRAITEAVWRIDPTVTIVGCGRWDDRVAMAGSPCLTGQRCDMWDEHYYRSSAQMSQMGSLYDHYNRSWPPVFVGEYAAKDVQDHGYEHLQQHQRSKGNSKGRKRRGLTLRAAVAEAIFLIGAERNGDVVRATAFAPLLNNVKGTRWSYNLINFNSTALFVLPSYHVIRLLRDTLGTHTLRHSLEGGAGRWLAVASAGPSPDQVAIKLASYFEKPQPVSIRLGTPLRARSAEGAVLTAASPNAENSLEQPNAVVPRPIAVRMSDGGVTLAVRLPAWSVCVVRVTLAH